MSSTDEIGSTIRKMILPVVLSMFFGNIINYEIKAEVYTEVKSLGYKEDIKSEGLSLASTSNKMNEYNVLERFIGLTNAYSISIYGQNIGYISTDERIGNIISEIKDIYIDNFDIDKNNIISTDISCDINSEKVITAITEISTSRKIAEEIYDLAREEYDGLNINVKTIEKNNEEILPETSVLEDDNLFIGEIKEESGESGVKEILQEVTYTNGEIVNVNVLSENILIEPKSTVIKNGTKNPYDYGVAFLMKPIRGGTMTSNYGPRWQSFHKGIDIAGNLGDDVLAAVDGEITYAQYNDGGYGNLIMIKHDDNMVTYYAHLNDINVKVGQKISKGDVIGKVGSTGFSTGPHLHFELRVDGNHVDPNDYIIKE